MGVIFRGGGSGSRGKDFAPAVPDSGTPQPIQYTETHGPHNPNVILNTLRSRSYNNSAEASEDKISDFMPTGGTDATGEDLQQGDIAGLGPNSGDQSVFKGSPNTGTKGGPE